MLTLITGLAVGVHEWTKRGVIFLGDPSWPSLRLASLSRIDIYSPRSGMLHFSRDGENWTVRAANATLGVPADTGRLRDVLSFIGKHPPLSHVTRFSRRIQSTTGLDNSTIGITLEGSEPWSISLGTDGTEKNSVYARSSLQGDQVHLVDVAYRDVLSRPAEYFYDLALVRATAVDDIVKINVEGPASGVWEIARSGDKYVFSAPETLKAQVVAQAKADLYLHTLAGARATGVAPNPVDIAASVQLTLQVWTGRAKTPETVTLYHDGGDGKTSVAVLSRFPLPLLVDADIAAKLSASAFALREKPVLTTGVEQVEQHVFTMYNGVPPREVHVVRSEGGWTDEATGTPLPGLNVIIWRLAGMEFIDTPRKEAPQGISLALDWRFSEPRTNKQISVLFYTDPVTPGRCWARVNDEGMWFPVDSLLLSDLRSRLPAPASAGSDTNNNGTTAE